MLHGGDAAHHVHGLDVFRADGAHVGSQVHVVGPEIAPGRGVLEVGVVPEGLSVNGELRSEGRCDIVRRQGPGSAQIHDLRGAQGRVAGGAARQEFQDVGDAGGLDVGDGVGPDLGRRGEAVVLLGGDDHLLQG